MKTVTNSPWSIKITASRNIVCPTETDNLKVTLCVCVRVYLVTSVIMQAHVLSCAKKCRHQVAISYPLHATNTHTHIHRRTHTALLKGKHTKDHMTVSTIISSVIKYKGPKKIHDITLQLEICR